jgi:hypothetical protein
MTTTPKVRTDISQSILGNKNAQMEIKKELEMNKKSKLSSFARDWAIASNKGSDCVSEGISG